MVLTDDQGYGDLGIHQNPLIQTPHINKLAQESVRFSNFHVDPTCSPTRAALFSGQNSLKSGVWHTVMGRSLLPAEHYTLAEALRDNGYQTGLFGKWHLGDNYPFRPEDQGFTHVVNHGGGGVGQTPDYWGNTQFGDTYFKNGKPKKYDAYATKIWFDQGIEFIKANKDKPFFAYISTNAPHAPFRAPKSYVDAYLNKGISIKGARFFAMITYLDEQVGRLRDVLAQEQLSDNTIFIFATDNGSTMGEGAISPRGVKQFRQAIKTDENLKGWLFNAGMRGMKNSIYEGGHRVPLFIHYPEKFGQPREVNTLTVHTDIYPTLMELAGGLKTNKQQLDGKSLVPLLTQTGTLPDRSIMLTNQRVDIPSINRPTVLMSQQWRYVTNARGSQKNTKLNEQLFDINQDPSQKNDVSQQHPELIKNFRVQLKRAWQVNNIRADKRERIIIGHADENPARLTGMDWMEAKSHKELPVEAGFVAMAAEKPRGFIGKEDKIKPLPWYLHVAQRGTYQFDVYFWDKPAGKPIKRKFAFLEVNGTVHRLPVHGNAAGVRFTLALEKAPIKMRTWFADNDKALNQLPGIYVYAKRLTEKN